MTLCAGVDRVWLHRWIRKNSYSDPRVEADAERLDQIIRDFILLHPERGERMVIGYLRSERLKVTREEVSYTFMLNFFGLTVVTVIDTCINTSS